MNPLHYLRVAACVPNLEVANTTFNTEQIILQMIEANKQNANLAVFPELSITGYTCADLFHQQLLLDEAIHALDKILSASKELDIVTLVGMPLKIEFQLFNCAVVIHKGLILGVVPKTYLPTYNEFYETRWFSSARTLHSSTYTLLEQIVPVGTDLIFQNANDIAFSFGAEICEDLWAPYPPSTLLALQGATLIANLSASNELIGKHEYRKNLLSTQSAKTMSAYIYTSSGFGESTTDIAFGGHALIYENGQLLTESKRFSLEAHINYADIDVDRLIHDRIHLNTYNDYKAVIGENKIRYIQFHQDSYHATNKIKNIDAKEIHRLVDPHPFVPSNKAKREIRCKEIFDIQSTSLAKRLQHIGHPKAVIGISGGLDSTLALLVTVKTFDLLGWNRKDIIGITMPGFGTTGRTYENSLTLMEALHITQKEISIKEAVKQHFKDIEHDPSLHNITYENSQARERTQILMNYANKVGGIVIGTGDLSELALGFATYNGDHMSMYGVNASIPKTLVRYLVQYVADIEGAKETKRILYDVLDTPVSPELLPPTENGSIAQKTEEFVGPYELHDFFLYNMLRFGYSPKKIFTLANIAFANTYTDEEIKKWMTVFYRRFFQQQFKRSCLPDGPKVGSICISPRGDLRMPSDAVAKIWLEDILSLS